MPKDDFITRYTPSLMSHSLLETLTVGRKPILEDLVNSLRTSLLSEDKHHVLVCGARGMGKTHMVSLACHRLVHDERLQGQMAVAWLKEEEWGITSYLDFLRVLLRVLHENSSRNGTELLAASEDLVRLPIDEAEHRAEALLQNTLAFQQLLLLFENFAEVLENMTCDEQSKLRKFFDNSYYLTVLATSQDEFHTPYLPEFSFHGFFEVLHLGTLSLEDSVALLERIAKHKDDLTLARQLSTPMGKTRVKVLYHLAAGTPRVLVIFAQYLSSKNLNSLIEPLTQTLDDLIPYYQARMAQLSPQQRKIVAYLCQRRRAAPVMEIAEQNSITHQTASGQLKKLRELGYVYSMADGRESYYELLDPLMRITLELKQLHGESLRRLVDCLRIWYAREEPSVCLPTLWPATRADRFRNNRQLKFAFDNSPEDPPGFSETPIEFFPEELAPFEKERSLNPFMLGRYEDVLEDIATALVSAPTKERLWVRLGVTLEELGHQEDALKAFDTAVDLEPTLFDGWLARGSLLISLGRNQEAITSFQRAIDLSPTNPAARKGLGFALTAVEQFEEAVLHFKEALELGSGDYVTHIGLAIALEELGLYDEALEAYKEAVHLDKEDSSALCGYATLLAFFGQYDPEYVPLASVLGLLESASPDRQLRYVAAQMQGGRWEAGLQQLDTYVMLLAQNSDQDTDVYLLFVRDLLVWTRDETTWRKHIAAWIASFKKYNILLLLAHGLIGSIHKLKLRRVTVEVAQLWLKTWMQLAGEYPEMALPLRLLKTAVAYKENPSKRTLAGLPIEERDILEPLLGLPAEVRRTERG
jgi:tetratricopeptide (TPR) repeat protein